MYWETPRLGQHSVTVKVTDGKGGVDLKIYTIDVVNPQSSEIRGTVFKDTDRSGGFDNFFYPQEKGLPGVTVYLDLNNNGTLDSNEPFQISAVDNPDALANEVGQYQFTGLSAGNYVVRTVAPNKYEQSQGTLSLLQPNPDVAATFIGQASISTDGLGTLSGIGILQAQIPPGSKVEYAFLHVATLRDYRPGTIGFDGTAVPITWLQNVDSMAEVNNYTGFILLGFETGRADVTALVTDKLKLRVVGSDAILDFAVDETVSDNPYGRSNSISGTSLTVIYSNPTLPQRTIVILEGGLTGPESQTTLVSLNQPIGFVA